MAQIQDNNATEYIYGQLFGYNFEEDYIPGKEDIEKLTDVSNFAEYVYKHAARCGYDGDAGDTSKIAAFVEKLCADAGVKIGSDTKKRLQDGCLSA